MKSYTCWVSGNKTLYQVFAENRKHALGKFSGMLNIKVSSYLHARISKKDYALLESTVGICEFSVYGITR